MTLIDLQMRRSSLSASAALLNISNVLMPGKTIDTFRGIFITTFEPIAHVNCGMFQ